MGDYIRRLAARPHHVGSPYDKDNAEWILEKLKSWGLDARFEIFEVLFPTPKDRALELVEPENFKAKLQEPTVAVDPTSGQHSEQLPKLQRLLDRRRRDCAAGVREQWNSRGLLGNSTGLVSPVKGAIVIARYGGSWRGIKPKVAAEHGAVGCIIYSDPHEDGYAQGEVFPARVRGVLKTACSAEA